MNLLIFLILLTYPPSSKAAAVAPITNPPSTAMTTFGSSNGPTPLELRREKVAKAIMMLRMGRSENSNAYEIAVRELKSIDGFTKEKAHILQTALGALYYGVNDRTGEIQLVQVLTADYDRKLADAAQLSGLGRDFQSYLKSAFPQLLEGRLRTSDALQPQFIRENVSTVLALAQNNFPPFHNENSHLLLKYLESAGPSLAKVPEWRAGVRNFLMNATPAQLEKFGDGVGIFSAGNEERGGRWASPYRALFWDVGDIFEDVAAAKKGSMTEGALQRLAPNFPRNGLKDLAKKALSVGSASLLKGLESSSSETLTDFYSTLSNEIKRSTAAKVNPTILKNLFKFSIGRLNAGGASQADVDLIAQIVPDLIRAESDYNNFHSKWSEGRPPKLLQIVENLEDTERMLSVRGVFNSEKGTYLRSKLRSTIEKTHSFRSDRAMANATAIRDMQFEREQRALECQTWFAKLSRFVRSSGR